MQVPRVQFTVRLMMIAVAALATLLGIASERHRRFRKLAGDYAARAQALGLGARIPVNVGKSRLALTRFGEVVEDSPEILRLERRYWWLRDMSAKYDQASRLPLFPVLPDPPEPE